ncbi:MAG: sugar phosphate isomerase/epimerase family protein [Acidobacteriota bacterium]
MSNRFSRRSFLAATAAAPLAVAHAKGRSVPVGLELYSVRHEMDKDVLATVRGVGKMGYDCVEFYGSYYSWTDDYAKKVRALLDELRMPCHSTHNDPEALTPEGIKRAIELNKILGSRYIVMASAGEVRGADGWKRVADTLNQASSAVKGEGLRVGYHNHDAEWKPVDGQKPIEILSSNTDKSVMLQLDVGTCLETGNDPVAWIDRNPGRIRSIHCKEWSPEKGYKALFGEGKAEWKKIFDAAEKTGGVEFYLIEQEGSEYPEMETAKRCLASCRKLRAS